MPPCFALTTRERQSTTQRPRAIKFDSFKKASVEALTLTIFRTWHFLPVEQKISIFLMHVALIQQIVPVSRVCERWSNMASLSLQPFALKKSPNLMKTGSQLHRRPTVALKLHNFVVFYAAAAAVGVNGRRRVFQDKTRVFKQLLVEHGRKRLAGTRTQNLNGADFKCERRFSPRRPRILKVRMQSARSFAPPQLTSKTAFGSE